MIPRTASFHLQISWVPFAIGICVIVLGIVIIALRHVIARYNRERANASVDEKPALLRSGLGTDAPQTTLRVIISGSTFVVFGLGIVLLSAHLI